MLDTYEIEKAIGEGGCGRVYLARQRLVDRLVAIKFLSRDVIFDETSLKRFQREAQIASSLDHPNIARVYAYGVSPEDGPYLVMEYLEGKTLAALIKKSGKLSIESFLTIFSQICSALEYAHGQGIIHRDVKPGNIMIVSAGGIDTVKVLDFGIARKIEDASKTATLTQTGTLIGTPNYMSPEQCTGAPCDQRSDIYALGCVMYEALCGSPPFTGDSPAAVMLKQLNMAVPEFWQIDPALRLPPSIVSLVYRCMSKTPSSRPDSAAEVARSLLQARGEAPVKVAPPRVPLYATNTSRIIFGSVGVAIVVVTVVFCVTIFQKARHAVREVKQRKIVQTTWTNIEDLLEKADQQRVEKKLSMASESYNKLVRAVLMSAQSEQEKPRANQVLYRAYWGLSKTSLGLGEPVQHNVDSMKKAIIYATKACGPGSDQVATLELELATILADSGFLLDEAEKVAKELLAIRTSNFKRISKTIGGDEIAMGVHRERLMIAECRLGAAESVLGRVYMKENRKKEALKVLSESLELECSACGETDENTVWTMYHLCRCLFECNKQKEADVKLAQFLQLMDLQLIEPNLSGRQWMLYEFANYFKNRHDYKRNKIVVDAFVTMTENESGEISPETKKAKQLISTVQMTKPPGND